MHAVTFWCLLVVLQAALYCGTQCIVERDRGLCQRLQCVQAPQLAVCAGSTAAVVMTELLLHCVGNTGWRHLGFYLYHYISSVPHIFFGPGSETPKC